MYWSIMKITYRDQNRVLHQGESQPSNGVDIAVLAAGSRMAFVRDLAIEGEVVADRFVVPPGGVFTLVRGEFERTDAPEVPAWAQTKLETSPVAKRGPYTIAFSSDRYGNEVGGGGIAPYWQDWRKCEAGYQYALKQLQGVLHRMPIAFHDEVQVEKFALQLGFDTPIGYTYSLDDALRWDPNAQDYLSYHKIDGQHLMRAMQAMRMLDGLHPIVEWYKKNLLRYVRLSYERRDMDPVPENRRLWSVQQWLDAPEDIVRTGCGRELAHVARLVWEYDGESQLATDFEDMLLNAGIPWFLDNRSIYAPESRIEGGGPFKKYEPIAHTFEWCLMVDAARKRPALRDACRDMQAFMGDRPPKTMNASGQGYLFDDGPNDYALFRGDFSSAGYDDAQHLLDIAASRGVEDNPLDCCPRRFWKEAL